MSEKNTRPNERILIVSNSLTGGGAEKSMLLLHKQLQNLKANTFLLTLNCKTDMKQFKTSRSIIQLDRKWRSGIFGTLATFIEFNKIVYRLNPKVIIINCELPELYTALLPKFRAKLIVVEHTSQPWIGKKILGSIVRSILYIKKCDWVTVNSSQNKVWMGIGKARFIPNPIFVSHDKDIHVTKKPTITYIGSIKKNKRPNWVINTAIKSGLPIYIYGTGPELADLKKEHLNNSMVEFKGHRNNPWSEIYRNSLIVVPSLYEGDGLVVAEGIANGNPILLSDNRDLRRFSLPDKHYFKDEASLNQIIEKNKWNNFKFLTPKKSYVNQLIKERSLDRIGKVWHSYLLSEIIKQNE